MEIRTSCINDFEEIYNLFTQLWTNKELHKQELLKVYERGLNADTDYHLSEVENDLGAAYQLHLLYRLRLECSLKH